MRLVVLADGLFEAPVVVILGAGAVGEVGIGVGQQFREDVVPVEGEAAGHAAVGLEDEGVVAGVAGLVAVLDAGADALVLRIGAESLGDGAEALGGEGRVGRGDAGADGEGRGDVGPEDIERLGAAEAVDEVVIDVCGHLVHDEQAGLQMGAGAAVVTGFDDEVRGDLPLDGEGPEGVFGGAGGFLALPVVDVQAV